MPKPVSQKNEDESNFINFSTQKKFLAQNIEMILVLKSFITPYCIFCPEGFNLF